MSVLSMPEWETFRRESESPQNPSITAGLSLSHHRLHPTSFSSEQTKRVILFTPASCFLGEFHALDEHSKQFRMNNAKTTLQTYLAAQESSNPLFHEGASSTTPPIVVMWNDVTTNFESLVLPHTATLVVVVPDRGLDDVSKMHQEMSAVTSRIPTLVVSHDIGNNKNNVVGARVFGLPSLTHMTVAGCGGDGRDDGTTQQRYAPLPSLVSEIQFLSFEFLIASLHFGQWCVPEDYLLPQFHGNNACKLPDWQYYRTLCPPCAPHALNSLSTLTSLANLPKGETFAAGRKRVRCVSAEESQKMLHNLEFLTRNDNPTVVGPLTSVAPPKVHHGNERECGGRQSASKHAIVSSHQNGSWHLAEAPTTFTDLMVERGNCFSQAPHPSSHSWTLPRLLSDALQSFVGTAIDSAVDVAGLSMSEQRVLRTVAKYSSALHRCFQIHNHHHHKNLTTTATHAPPSSSLAPLELVWIAIGNELGVSGDDAFNQFSSLVIPPKKRPHNDPHSSSVAAAKNEEALNLQRMNAVHDCVIVLDPLQELRNRHCAPPPSMTTHDVAEGTTAVDNSAVASSIDASLSLLDSAEFDKALQFRVALPRIDQAISIQSEAVDKLLLVVQQCLLDKLRDSLVPQHHPQQHDV